VIGPKQKEVISFVRPISPRPEFAKKEKAVKYLGLIIEKDIEFDTDDEEELK
jgi:hypothetical protein